MSLPQWPAGHRLLVAGDPGDGFAPPSHSDVTMLGHVQPDRLRSLMAGARGLVFPSVWLEGLALVCLEALSVGTPILTFDDIPAGRSVTELGIGLAAPRDGFAMALAQASSTFPTLREHCAAVFAERFTPAAWLARIEAVYARALGAHQ